MSYSETQQAEHLFPVDDQELRRIIGQISQVALIGSSGQVPYVHELHMSLEDNGCVVASSLNVPKAELAPCVADLQGTTVEDWAVRAGRQYDPVTPHILGSVERMLDQGPALAIVVNTNPDGDIAQQEFHRLILPLVQTARKNPRLHVVACQAVPSESDYACLTSNKGIGAMNVPVLANLRPATESQLAIDKPPTDEKGEKS